MANLSQLRQKYPQYNDMGDQEFADKFHGKYYGDMPKEDFYSKIGFSSDKNSVAKTNEPKEPTSILEDIAIKSAETIPELASMAMSLPGEAYGAIRHPLQTLKNIPIGLAEGALGTVNIPGNISRYLAGKGYPTATLSKILPHSDIGDVEKILGLEAKEPGEGLVRGLSGFGLMGKLGGFGEASNLKRAGLGAGYAIGQEQNPLTGAILGALPGIVKKGQEAYNYFKEPKRALSESKEILQNIKHLLAEQVKSGETEKTGIHQFMNQVQEGLTSQQENLNSQLPELFPIQPKSLTRKNLNEATSNSVNELNNNFNRRYNDFNQSYGRRKVHEPFQWHDINLDNLPHVSLTTRKMGFNASNDKLHYETPEGEKVTVDFPAENSTVQDYVNFSRELRDAASAMSRQAKNATHGDKMSLLTTRNRLRQLQGQAEQRIEETVGKEGYHQYRGIQDDYSHLMGPVKDEPAIYNAAYRKKISNQFHDTLTQPANEHLRGYLNQSPEFVGALRTHLMQGSNHPLSTGAMINPAAINADIQYLLSPEQRAAQAEQLQLHQAQEHINQVGQHIKSPETLTPLQEQQVHQFHPRTSHYLTNEMQRAAIKRSLEHQKSEHQMTKEERERTVSKRNRIATGIGTALAVTQGHKITNLIKRLF